jgi:hypothetical protein
MGEIQGTVKGGRDTAGGNGRDKGRCGREWERYMRKLKEM